MSASSSSLTLLSFSPTPLRPCEVEGWGDRTRPWREVDAVGAGGDDIGDSEVEGGKDETRTLAEINKKIGSIHNCIHIVEWLTILSPELWISPPIVIDMDEDCGDVDTGREDGCSVSARGESLSWSEIGKSV